MKLKQTRAKRPRIAETLTEPNRQDDELLYLGIDPGTTGAWAVVGFTPHSQRWRVAALSDIPCHSYIRNSKKRNRVDAMMLAADMKPWAKLVDMVTCELVFAPPGIMSTVAFSLGQTACAVDTALDIVGGLKGKRYMIAPRQWKNQLRLGQSKELSRLMATNLFGSETADRYWPAKKHHNRAEAVLIAVWQALNPDYHSTKPTRSTPVTRLNDGELIDQLDRLTIHKNTPHPD